MIDEELYYPDYLEKLTDLQLVLLQNQHRKEGNKKKLNQILVELGKRDARNLETQTDINLSIMD